ncbi:MAG: MBL fold metallo-hydrolase [bacterium]
MNITKLGHACLVVEESGVRVLVDPGSFTTEQNELSGLDAVVITHEHQDHLNIASLKKVIDNNPDIVIIANASIGAVLEKEGIAYARVGDGEKIEVKGLAITGSGKDHATICDGFGLVENTGYFIGSRFFYPGDAFHNPGIPVGVLALPVAGPWMKISEAVDYVKAVRPEVCFPVHDGMYKSGFNIADRIGEALVTPLGIDYVPMKDGENREF